MSTVITYPHIEKSGREPARLQRLPRIRVAQIAMDQIAHGWSAEEIVRQHPELTMAEVLAALLYYQDHLEEIDAEIAEELRQVEEDRRTRPPSKFLLRMRAEGRLK